MKKLLAICISSVVLVYCTASKKLCPAPSEKELTVAQKNWAGTTLEELNEGQSIYKNQCTECHKNFEITKFSEKKWKHEIEDMSPKAKLSEEQKLKLTKYILSYREANTVASK